MLILHLTFTAGRYHATPWGRHVNEADVEWPPSPWRVVRGIIATWHRKLDHARFPESTLISLLTNLASESPSYHVPLAVHAHTRHYMPIREGKTEKPTLVFDAFASVARDKALWVVWPSIELNQDEVQLLDAALEATGYLGRSESWVEARRVPEGPEKINCRPGESTIDESTGESLGEPIMLFAPTHPAEYKSLRAALLGRGLPGKQKTKVVTTLPESWLAALSLETANLQSAGWSAPPSARRIQYIRPNGALSPSARPRPKPLSLIEATTVRYALYGKPLPLINDAVKVGEWLRAAAMSNAKQLFGADRVPPVLSGHDLPDTNRHRHAFWLPEDADGDGRVDHLVVHVPAKLDKPGRQVLEHIERLWNRNGQEWRVLLESVSDAKSLSTSSPLFGCVSRWISVTPYLHPWHVKKNFTVEDQIQRECRERGLPEVASLEYLPAIRVNGRERRPIHFHRFRTKRGLVQPDTHGSFWRLTFTEPVQGPLAFGFGCHFGLGLFRMVSSG